MKIVKIGMWYLVFILLVSSLFFLITTTSLPGLEASLIQYDHELWRYRFTSPSHQRTVLIGPSYVSNLGSGDGFYNLGYYAANLNEVEIIIEKYSSPKDNIIFGLGSYHFLTYKDSPREFPFNSFIRYKMAALSVICPEPQPDMQHFLQNQAQMFSGISNRDIVESVAALKKFHHKFPHVQLVLFPLSSGKSCPGAQIANQNIAFFRSSLLNSGLPITDLSDSVPEKYFFDFFHFTEPGVKIVQQRLPIKPLS